MKMHEFTQSVTRVLDARQVKNETKERWVALMDAGSDEQHAAKQAFLAADDQFSMRAGELGKMLLELRDRWCMDTVLEALPEELRLTLYKVIAETRLDYVLAPVRLTNIEEVAHATRNAAALLDAARRIDERRLAESFDNLDALAAEAEEYRAPDAWRQTMSVVELFFDTKTCSDDDAVERVADATRATGRHMLFVYDQLMEQLQGQLEDLYYDGKLEALLPELDVEVARYLVDVLHSGIVRQRQLQTETRTQSSTSTMTEVETSAQDAVE